jgi:hypothetical protein
MNAEHAWDVGKDGSGHEHLDIPSYSTCFYWNSEGVY